MDFGAAVSQKEYDVKTVADRLLAYSSAFRSLKVFATYTGSTTIPTAGNTNTVTFTHNLGYYAPCVVVYNGSTALGTGSSYFMSDNVSNLTLKVYTDRVEVLVADDFDQGFSSTGNTVYFTCYQFIETFDSYTADIISTDTTATPEGTDYGYRASKANKDVMSCADVDLILSSSFFTSTVHKKGTDTTGSVAHGLGYVPSFLGFIKYSGDSFLSLNNPSLSATTSSVDCVLDTGDVFYYVILKGRQI